MSEVVERGRGERASAAQRQATPSPAEWPLGRRLRIERTRLGMSARELARRLEVSPSLVSQIETGKIQPSVRTLYAMVSVLGVSVEDLFAPIGSPPAAGSAGGALDAGGSPSEAAERHVLRRDDRRIIELQSGVRWEWLTKGDDRDVEFVRAVYGVGGASSPDGKLVRHNGHEFGLVLSGRLRVTVGFEECVLEAGDSISFPSSIPHRLRNDGDEVVDAIWVVIGR